jgi:hypothetical protein
MNNRIKELANQCRIEYRDGHGGFIEQFDEETFAELIVRECAKVSEDDITDGDACCTNTAYRIASQIKEHFGVD